MIIYVRALLQSAFILTMSFICLHAAMAGEVGGSGAPGASSAFASETRFLGDTNESYGKRASVEFPDKASDYFFRVRSAREMLRTGDCAGAVELLEKATDEYTDHGNVWGLLAKCRAEIGEWEGAANAYKEALKLGVKPWDSDLDLNPNDMMISIAGVYAQAGNEEKSLAWLRRGLMAHYDERPHIAEAPEFANLRADVEFAKLAGLRPSGLRSRNEEWLYDIDFLREQVAMLHADPDHLTHAVELERMLSSLAADVANLSDEQITARIDLFIGALGGGHDLFWPVFPDRGAMLPFALKIYLFTDGIYIIDAYDRELIGSRIDLFGETPAAMAYEIVANAFPGDNDMEARWMGVRHLTQAYTLEALGIIDDAEIATLTVIDKTGVRRLITPERRGFTSMSPALTAPPDVSVPLYLSRMEENYWTHQLDDLSALYVQLKNVANGDDESIAEFAERVSREAADPSIRNLILDLRHSPGGNGYLTPPLLRKLIHFEASSVENQLFVIIGRNTFSASHNLITDLDWISEPVFVGEPSGSRPNTLSESGQFVLPFSRLSGYLSSQLHQQSWPEDHRIWIAPDLPVGLSSIEFFAGRDPALEAIAALIDSKMRQQATIEADYIFENVNVVPLNAEVVLANKAVAVHNGEIVAIVDQSLADNIKASTRIDAAGKYLMPGLTDMHIHMRMNPQAAFNLFLANGVTTVFNMGLADRDGDVEINHLQLRDDVAAGRMDGPRYLVSGPQLHAEELPALADVEPMLDHHVEMGYDVIKVHGSLDDDVYVSLISGARERDLRITGHAQHLRPLSDSLHVDAIEHMEEFVYVSRDPAHAEAATGSVENYLKAYFLHAERMSEPEYRVPVVRDVAESGIYIDPTLIIYSYILNYVSDDLFAELQLDDRLAYLPRHIRSEYMNPETNEYRTGFGKLLSESLGDHDAAIAHLERNIETFSALLFEMHEAGVPILLGTDLFGAVVPGFSVHQELELMVDAGLSPYEALRTGTVNVAAYLGETERAGTVEVGKRADFIMLAANPLADIGNAADVSGVYSHGKWRSASDLATILLEAKVLSAGAD